MPPRPDSLGRTRLSSVGGERGRLCLGFGPAHAIVIGEVAVLAQTLRVVLLLLVFARPRILLSFPLVVAADAHIFGEDPSH